MHVKADLVGMIIGRGGETINAISRDTGAKVEVSRDDYEADRVVRICGTSEQIEKAMEAIEDRIKRARERLESQADREPTAAGTGAEPRADAAAVDERRNKSFQVAQEFVGVIIGKGGEKIKAMSREAGARIEVSREDCGATRTVTVTGAPEAIDRATAAVEECVRRAREMFDMASSSDSGDEMQKLPAPPPGFELCEHEAYLHHPGKNIFFERMTGRLCWFDASRDEYRNLYHGETHDLTFTGSAVTRLDSGRGSAGSAGTAVAAVAETLPAPKHVFIPELHRVGQALKLPFDHIDRPSSMLGVFGAVADGQGVPVDIAARGLYEKLVRRLAASRSAWADEALFGAVSGALFDITAGCGGAQPVAAVALVVGRRVVAVAAPGTSLCVITGDAEDSALPSEAVVAGGATSCFEELRSDDDRPTALFIALAVGETQLDDGETVIIAAPHLYRDRPRAASAALLRAARERGAAGHLAAACARLGYPKRPPKTEDASLRKVRVRQILIRHWKGSGAQPTNPVRRRPVSRSPEEAEVRLLGALERLLLAEKDELGPSFSSTCKELSECQSALKGGELVGDLGWLDLPKDAAMQQAKGQPGIPKSVIKAVVPAPVIKASFELEVGELSDLVPSELGIHLLLRTA